MGPKIKRERLSKADEPVPTTIIKSEPISDKEDDDELTMPDPDAPKNYKRIRVSKDDDGEGSSSSSDEDKASSNKKTNPEKKRKSDLQSEEELSEEYVPLCNVDAVSSGDDSDDESDNGRQTRRVRNNAASTKSKSSHKTSNQKKAGANKKKIGVRTRRQKANDPESSSEEDSSDSEYETGSLNGFIIEERKTKQKNKQSPAKRKRRSPSKSSESSESDDSNDRKTKYKNRKQKSPSPKRMLRGQNKRHNKLREESSTSSSSEYSDDSRNGVLSNDVVSELKGFLPATAGVSSKPKRPRHNLVLDSRVSPELVGGSDSSFIDDDETEKRAGLLESSSSSDEDVVPEDPSNLDLNTDNFETLPTSDESYGDSSDSEKSQSSATDEERDAYKNIENEKESTKLEDCCTMCWNLEDTNFRARETHPYADRWCRCTRCEITSPRVQLGYDRICCREINAILKFIGRTAPDANKLNFCITRHQDFEKDVLNYGAVLKAFKGKKSKAEKEFKRATDKEKVNKVKDCFLRWIFGKDPGKMVVPCCVIKEIKKRHAPSAGPLYFSPFNCTKFCRVGKHCVKARL